MATQILMPALSPTMEEGKLAKWLVKEGDEVHSGDILAEIETDKATMEFEAVDEGRIGKILIPEGTEGVKVNQPIAMLIGEGESAASVDIASAMQSIKRAIAAEAKPAKPSDGNGKAAEGFLGQSQQPRSTAKVEPRAPASADAQHRVFASPLARRQATRFGIDIAALSGSGPRGRIVKADVEAAYKSGQPATRSAVQAPAPPRAASSLPDLAPLPDALLFYKPEDYDEIPHDSMRKSIARRLSSAKALIPHFYLTIDCRIDELAALRGRLNDKAPKGKGAYKLSINDFIVKAAASPSPLLACMVSSTLPASSIPHMRAFWRWVRANYDPSCATGK